MISSLNGGSPYQSKYSAFSDSENRQPPNASRALKLIKVNDNHRGPYR